MYKNIYSYELFKIVETFLFVLELPNVGCCRWFKCNNSLTGTKLIHLYKKHNIYISTNLKFYVQDFYVIADIARIRYPIFYKHKHKKSKAFSSRFTTSANSSTEEPCSYDYSLQ